VSEPVRELLPELMGRVREELEPGELARAIHEELERFGEDFRDRYLERLSEAGVDVDEYRFLVDAVCRSVERALKDTRWILGMVAERSSERLLERLEEHLKLKEE